MRFIVAIGFYLLASLSQLYAQTWTVFDSSNSGLTSNQVTRLHRDSADVLYIGTLGGGLNSYDGTFWQVQATGNSFIPGDSIFSLTPDKQGFLWVGTEGGLGWRFGLGIWNVYDNNNSPLPENRIRSVFADPAGDIWAGSSQGIAWLDNPTWTLFNKTNSGMRGNLHYGINTVDKDGRLWAATLDGGIGIYQNGVWSNYDTGNSGLPVNAVKVVFQDFFNDLWIGTQGGGLVNLERLNWNVADTSNSAIPGMTINCIKEEIPGRLWIGFEGQGLALYENENWTVFTQANSGLPSDTVNDVFIEKGERIWVATSQGLAVSETIIGTEDAFAPRPLRLYPNPARSQLNVEIDRPFPEHTNLEIRNPLGQLLRSRPVHLSQGPNHLELDIAHLSPGMYFIRVGAEILSFIKD